ncbi:phosphogluconate dehydrogenase (NAD(+)-dependent, decarboxylating) [Rubricoccus marinus]|uniref:6-phosphogluconate dehydrogenase (Decarboxylating) n=1 Tax=Rubricoccus marinus TaxID=716817 RepID=A0A259TWR2_9BACT|nr:decarboxylating 6-phosphogluconate dehydrogenase [Rubricoccus marinus]OZC02024.1 6-phosphogluconate dehydrogenase (decarboxylating) [Rubricoccus marinus]
MDIGIVGLGRMGLNMAIRLSRGGHRVLVSNRSQGPIDTAVEAGAEGTESVGDLIGKLESPRVVWLMLPAGQVTDDHVDEALEYLEDGDILVEGGNTRWTDTLARAERARGRGVHYVDAGVSGGVWGLENGYSIMFGASDHAAERITPVIQTLAPSPEAGWGHVGPTGAGHFTKMVHNGIEYGMMQAFAEGFAILDAKKDWGTNEAGDEITADLDLGQIASLWREGSVVQSWLLDLIAEALVERPGLKAVAPHVPDSGEGRWTVEAAIDLGVPATVIAASLFARFSSRDETQFASRVLSAMRGQFGGHPVKGDSGVDGEYADQISDAGTVEIIPGGVRTEGAASR